MALGVAGLVAAIVVINVAPNNDPHGVGYVIAVGGTSFGGVAVYAGMCGLLRSIRMRFHLEREAWVTRRASYRIAPMGPNGQPALLIRADELDSEAVCSVSATVWRYRLLPQGPDVALLVAGNPHRWSVIAPTDVSVLLVARRPMLPFWSKKLRQYATAW